MRLPPFQHSRTVRPLKRDLAAGVLGVLLGGVWLLMPAISAPGPTDHLPGPYATFSWKAMWPGAILLFAGLYYLSRWVMARRGLEPW